MSDDLFWISGITGFMFLLGYLLGHWVGQREGEYRANHPNDWIEP